MFHRLVGIALLVAATAACSKTETAQARGREAAVKAGQGRAGQGGNDPASVEVVGTLAAVDQVTISSEAEGKVSRILADLGDRVTAGRPLDPTRSREAAIQPRPAEGGARARARADTAPPTRSICPTSRRRRTCRKRSAELAQAKQAFDRAPGTPQAARSCRKQTLDDAETTLQSKQASYDSSLQNAKNLRASIQASDAAA